MHWSYAADGSTARLAEEGVSAGTASCALTADSSVSVTIAVKNAAVGASALYVRAVSGVSVGVLPSSVSTSSSSFDVQLAYEQVMQEEGAESMLFAYAETSDGQLRAL